MPAERATERDCGVWSLDCGLKEFCRHELLVNAGSFDGDQRRTLIALLGVNGDDASDGREPQTSVARLPACRIAPIAFAAQHAVRHAIRVRVDRFAPAFSEIVQLPQVGAVDATIATHPQIPAVVIRIREDLKREVVVQPVVDRDRRELSIFEAAQSTAVRANPEAAPAVFVKREDVIVG